MKYRMLGNTGLRVSELSFGTIPILAGHVPVLPRYYSPDADMAVQLMMQAYQLGCFSIPQLLSGVLTFPISSALLGLGTSQQIDCAMGEQPVRAKPPFAKVMSRLEKDFHPIPCDRCQRCHCAYGTDISTIFRQYNYFHMGKDYWALRKLNMGIEESRHMCQSCMEMPCIQLCPKGIHIPQMVDMIFKLVQAHYYYDNKNR